MNILTNVLSLGNARFDVEDTAKTGSTLTFDSSKEQRIVIGSIPSLSVTITYSGLSVSDFETIRTAYEENYANTFKFVFNDVFIDKRDDFMTTDSAVWVFTDFQFSRTPNAPISGKITILTSVFFNFPAYQNLHTESSTNTLSITTDSTFYDLIQLYTPIKAIEYKYDNNAVRSSIGRSARHQISKNGLTRIYGFTWLLQEDDFIKLLTFYRKNSGIMGEFGVPDVGINSNTLINSRFTNDTLQYVKRLDGLYECKAEFQEVKQ